MSGSRIDLVADVDGVLARLVAGITRLETAPLPAPWALVGGVAVMARLVEAHRVTRDVDTVTDTGTGDPGPTVAAVAVHTGGRVDANSIELDDGTKIDVIATGGWSPDALPDDDNERLNIVAHWWAAHTGEHLALTVVSSAGSVVATAHVPVATPAALVAAKLHAMRARRRAPEKAASDAYDIYRLLAVHDRDGSLSTSMAGGPADIAELCADAITETFVADAVRWARRIHNYAGGTTMGITDDDLEIAGSLFRDQLNEARG